MCTVRSRAIKASSTHALLLANITTEYTLLAPPDPEPDTLVVLMRLQSQVRVRKSLKTACTLALRRDDA
jgi:hypothetical protein